MAAGIAVTAGAITAAVLAIAGITGAITWGFLNQSEITGMIVLANAVTIISGVISTPIFTLITLAGWGLAGEPMTERCRQRRGLSPMGKRYRGPKRSAARPVLAGLAAGAAAGALGAAILVINTQGSSTSPEAISALSGLILGTLAGAGTGTGMTVTMLRGDNP